MAMLALASFTNDPRLSQLTDLLHRPPRFNILSALGLSRQELRHSALLAYLLDPHKPHGLGDRFARALLARAAPLLPETLDVSALSLMGMTVQTEADYIDVLIVSPADKVVVIIENKLDSDEHSDQLSRYYDAVRRARPGWRIVGIYLTLVGWPPAKAFDRERYVSLGYGDIAAALNDLAATASLEADVLTLLRHYAQLIRSQLVPDQDSDQARLARQLFVEHRETVEAITRARDTRMDMIQRTVQKLLNATAQAPSDALRVERSSVDAALTRWYNRFAPPEWNRADLQRGPNWTPSKLTMLFQFVHEPERVFLDLTVGPAEQARPLRQALYELAGAGRPPLQTWEGDHTRDYFAIYRREVFPLRSHYFAEASDDEIRRAITEHWQDFLQRDLPAIRATIRHEILGRTWNDA